VPDDLRSEIHQYVGYFREAHEKIRRVDERLHRKILSVTMISTLAEGRYASGRDRQKFVRLIEEHSGWAQSKAVSVIQLAAVIEARGKLGLSTAFVEKVQAFGRDPNRTTDIFSDPERDRLLTALSTKEETRIVNDATHASLLYMYRCKLVHEFREPGYPWEFDDDVEPIYRFGELVYPVGWLLELVAALIASLEGHYLSSRTNPYDAYKFGSPW
jgi:hypothetical protein